jgi:ATP-dependent RNA helicase DeaD
MRKRSTPPPEQTTPAGAEAETNEAGSASSRGAIRADGGNDRAASVAEQDVAKQDVADDVTRGFAALGLGAQALHAVMDLGYGTPTPIQEQTIPALLAGRDVIAQAPTGTGKTAAFGLPIVERLDESEPRPQVLVVAPTRELAIQVAEVLHALGRHRELVTIPIYGGAPYERQFRALARGVQVVVGTPGRLLDHLNRGTLDLSAIRMVVLDEADEMLDMGFLEDIEALLAALPAERLTALFSATIPPRIARLAARYMREPVRLSVAEREAVAPLVRQVYYEVPASAKSEALARILDLEQPESVIVFVRTRRDADVLSEQLSAQGYLAQAIHGEISQSQRERALERFREGRTQILVATDVAARGLDIPDVSHIINYDLPFDAESYVHRIGRTGRAGRSGEALTLITPRERRQLMNIERAIHRRLERLRLPTEADIAARRRAAFRDEVLRILDDGQLDPYLTLVEDLAGTRDPTELAAAAFKLAAQAHEASGAGRRTLGRARRKETAKETAPAPSIPRISTAAPTSAREATEEALALPGSGAARGDEAGVSERDGGPRPERRAARRFAPPRMARLVLHVGKRAGVRPADIVGAIANEAGIPGDAIGDIDLYDTFSFVEVPEDAVETVREALNQTTIRGRKPDAALAQEPWRATEDGRDRRDGRAPRRTGGEGGTGRWGARRRGADDDQPYWAAARGRRGSAHFTAPPSSARRRPGAQKKR